MTYAFTDTVQIDEGWEIPTDLYNELGKIEDLFNKIHAHLMPLDFLTGGSYSWAEEIAIAGILSQQPYDDIVEAILDGYDPTPDYMEIGEMF
jgi:hypothetical protein